MNAAYSRGSLVPVQVLQIFRTHRNRPPFDQATGTRPTSPSARDASAQSSKAYRPSADTRAHSWKATSYDSLGHPHRHPLRSHLWSLQDQRILSFCHRRRDLLPAPPYYVRSANLVCSHYRVYADLSLSRDHTQKPQRIDTTSNLPPQPEDLFSIS